MSLSLSKGRPWDFLPVLSFGRLHLVKFSARANNGSKTLFSLTKFPIYYNFELKFMTKFPKTYVFIIFLAKKESLCKLYNG